MKIILITLSLELGGSERRAITLARFFAGRGYDVEFWGLSGPGNLSKMCAESRIPWKAVPIKWFQGPIVRLGAIIRFAQSLRDANPDILLPHTLIPNTLCGLIWRWSGAKTCIGYEGGHEFGLAGKSWEKTAINRMPKIICNARHLAEDMAAFYRIDEHRIKIIPNGVVLPPAINSRSAWREQLGLEENTFLSVMVANLSGYKNHAALLRAWRLVLDLRDPEEQQAILLIAGKNFGTEPGLRKLAAELKIADQVKFLGYVEDVSGLLQAADLGVYSSDQEGCPNGVLECMRMGLAIAATDGEGMRDALGEDQWPWLSPLGDDESFAKNILALMSDPELRKDVGKKNEERAMREFSIHRMCEETEKLCVESITHSG